MPSDLQKETSRENGKLSQGPVTPEGKAASAANSIKHGLYAKSFLTKYESVEDYEIHRTKIFSSFAWKTGHEEVQVESLCNTQWRIQRCERLEAAALDADVPNEKLIELYSKHHARLQRIQDSLLREINRSIAARQAAEEQQLEAAALIRASDREAGRTTDLKTLGFVLSLEEVDARVDYNLCLDRADEELSALQNSPQDSDDDSDDDSEDDFTAEEEAFFAKMRAELGVRTK